MAAKSKVPATGGGPDNEPSLVDLQQTLYESRNPTRRWLHRQRRDLVINKVCAIAGAGATRRALEVGPGAGPYVGTLCGLYDEVVAIDIESEYLDHIRAVQGERRNLTLLEDDISASALEADSVDLVLCSEVIEHTPGPDAVVAGIARVLRPGGSLILSTPQPWSTVELLGRIAFRPGIIRITRLIYREPVLPTGHTSLVGRRRVRAMLERSGFEITLRAVFGMYLPVLAELGGARTLRWEQWLDGRLRNGPLAALLWTQLWIAVRTG
jgi:2-polyprenyl-3-methyl-5-hydroxy-6-metoxy-1,4-benzoquinol methylase